MSLPTQPPKGLQDLIYSLEEGKGAHVLKVGFLLIAMAALAALWNLRELQNFNTMEAMDNAQLARNIAEGKGFTTQFIRPLSIATLKELHGSGAQVLKDPHPDLVNAPLYPAMLAGWLKVVPVNYNLSTSKAFQRYQPEVWIAVFNQLIFLALLLATFFLVRKLFDSAAAFFTTMLLGVSDVFWQFSSSGLPTLLLALFMVGVAACLVAVERESREAADAAALVSMPGLGGAPAAARKDKPLAWYALFGALIGLLLGLGAMTRYSFGWLFIPVGAYLAYVSSIRRGAALGAMAGVFLLVCAPWLVRNYQVSGHVFGLAGAAIHEQVALNTGNRLMRSMPDKVDQELFRNPLSLYIRKLNTNLHPILFDELPKTGNSWLIAFFAVGLLSPFRNPGLNRLRWLVAGSLLFSAVVMALGRTQVSISAPVYNSENLLPVFLPLMFAFGAAFLLTLLEQIEIPLPHFRVAVVWGAWLVLSLPMIIRVLPPRGYPVAYPPYYPPMIQESSNWLAPNELMMSDMPWAVAWYGRRDCLWLTWDAGTEKNSDYFAINDFQKQIKAVYLTPITMDSHFLGDMMKNGDGGWSKFVLESLVRTNVPDKFPLKHAPQGYLPDQLFLSDHARWNESRK